MSALQPVGVYALRIPPGVPVPAVPDFAAMFRVTMAAVDPSEEIDTEDVDHKGPPRATLKVIRVVDDEDDSEDDEDYLDGLDDDSEDDSDDADANGGPSDKKSKKQALLEALAADAEEDEDEDEDMEDGMDDEEAVEEFKKLLKGKYKAIDGEDDEDEDEDDDSEEAIEMDECVLCTLDLEKNLQQPLDFVVGEGEKLFFQVSGTHTVHLTGNYVMPIDDGRTDLYDDEEDEEDYDLSPDEDELDELDMLVDGDEESDDLDDLDDPRVTELQSDEEAPKLVKGKNKRPAADSDDEATNLDDIMAKSIKKDEAATTNGDSKKLSKAEKKAAKKLKKNDGEASKVETVTAAVPEAKKEAAANGSEKKVQFSKDLVQGPTPSGTPTTKKDDKKAKPAATSASLGVRDISGVSVDDRKAGSGPPAKKGSKLELRYIGKLDNGKVFDSNKSGKPFSLKLGAGEVIKGWDLGLQGISAGGERRMTIPAHLAYGNKALPGIPKNSKLIFDVKCLSVK